MIFSFAATAVTADDDEDIFENETPMVNIFMDDEHIPNEIIVKFFDRSQFSGKEKQYDNELAKLKGNGFEIIGEDENLFLVKVDDLGSNANGVFNRYRNSKYVEYMELNYIATLNKAPTDPVYASRGSVYSKYINSEAGWDVITDSDVLVAIVDSGYNKGTDLPDASGYSVFNKNTTLTDVAGHGTQVAGTIGAVGNNGDKSVGVIWNANLLPIKITETTSVTLANVVSGIDEAVKRGAKIINLSLGFTSDSTSLKNAVDNAYNKGCIIVSATGNEAKSAVIYPAAYTNVLGVGGTSNGTARNANSNYGTGIDVMASWNWYSITINNINTISSGTSIATPQVSGLAALIWELNPKLTNAQVMQLIKDNTNRADKIWNNETGYGTIDMGKTLAAAKAGAEVAPKDTTPPVITLTGSQSIELTEGDAYTDPGYKAIDDKDGDITKDVAVKITRDNKFIVSKLDTKVPGVYRFEYTVKDSAGNESAAVYRVVTINAIVRTTPEITLLGEPVIEITQNDKYIEPGYAAFDDFQGNITTDVTVSSSLNASIPGEYKITYTVTNSANMTAEAVRAVKVNEIVRNNPELNLFGDIIIEITQGGKFSEPGYEAFDDFDGNITNSVTITGTDALKNVGAHTITYTVTNSAKLTSTATRIVGVQPKPVVIIPDPVPEPTTPAPATQAPTTQAPTTTPEPATPAPTTQAPTTTPEPAPAPTEPALSEPEVIEINEGETPLGTEPSIPEPTTPEPATEAPVTQAPTTEEPIYYTPPAPAQPPVLAIVGSNPIILHWNPGQKPDVYTEQGAKAYDIIDGDISSKVQILSNVDTSAPGVYTVRYSVTNNDGKEADIQREVRVLAPKLVALPRTTYSYSISGKQGTSTTNKALVAAAAGTMDIAVTSIDKNMTITLKVLDSAGKSVYSGSFSDTSKKQVSVAEGKYDVTVSIDKANGNSKYALSVTMPEVFEDVREGRVPLDILLFLNEGENLYKYTNLDELKKAAVELEKGWLGVKLDSPDRDLLQVFDEKGGMLGIFTGTAEEFDIDYAIIGFCGFTEGDDIDRYENKILNKYANKIIPYEQEAKPDEAVAEGEVPLGVFPNPPTGDMPAILIALMLTAAAGIVTVYRSKKNRIR